MLFLVGSKDYQIINMSIILNRLQNDIKSFEEVMEDLGADIVIIEGPPDHFTARLNKPFLLVSPYITGGIGRPNEFGGTPLRSLERLRNQLQGNYLITKPYKIFKQKEEGVRLPKNMPISKTTQDTIDTRK
jgi:hypothetical protein